LEHKVIRIIWLLAAVITISSAIAQLITKNIIPGLMHFSLAIVMFSLLYTTKKKYDEGIVSKGYWLFMFWIVLLAGTANILVGILQVISVA